VHVVSLDLGVQGFRVRLCSGVVCVDLDDLLARGGLEPDSGRCTDSVGISCPFFRSEAPPRHWKLAAFDPWFCVVAQ